MHAGMHTHTHILNTNTQTHTYTQTHTHTHTNTHTHIHTHTEPTWDVHSIYMETAAKANHSRYLFGFKRKEGFYMYALM